VRCATPPLVRAARTGAVMVAIATPYLKIAADFTSVCMNPHVSGTRTNVQASIT